MTPGETILVLAEPADEPQIQLLRERLKGTAMMVGSSFTALRGVLGDGPVQLRRFAHGFSRSVSKLSPLTLGTFAIRGA
jgi:hypothetical protein